MCNFKGILVMSNGKNGIVIAGNLLVDIVKNIDSYPKIGMLSHITDISLAVGGCVPNVAINLSKIDRSIDISAVGMVGDDENGKFVVKQLNDNGINTDMVKFSKTVPTGFSDVMSLAGGERTFFFKKGTNEVFAPTDIDVDKLDCDIFHVGYILLLDKFDEEDSEYGTKMARLLRQVQQKGIKTSVDVVSDNSADYGKKIISSLKYCNYVIINEIECCHIFNLEPYDKDGKLIKENVKLAMTKMMENGVQDKIIIHCKEMGFALDVKTKRFTEVASLKIPKEMIKGSVGAGDSFCAGSLYGLYNGLNDEEILKFSSAAAACNLFEANSIDGMKNKQEIENMANTWERLKLD